jgi:hypothetical protein
VANATGRYQPPPMQDETRHRHRTIHPDYRAHRRSVPDPAALSNAFGLPGRLPLSIQTLVDTAAATRKKTATTKYSADRQRINDRPSTFSREVCIREVHNDAYGEPRRPSLGRPMLPPQRRGDLLWPTASMT